MEFRESQMDNQAFYQLTNNIKDYCVKVDDYSFVLILRQKVSYSEKATKIWKNLPLWFDIIY